MNYREQNNPEAIKRIKRSKALLESSALHTTIPKETKRKLFEMGNGRINDGIINAVKIAEGKSIDVRDILLKIANKIIYEYTLKDEKGDITK